MDSTKKQVSQHIDVFRETGELAELRTAANLIGSIDVGKAPKAEDREAARAEKLDLWLTLLDTIDSAKDPNFDPADVPSARVTIPSDAVLKPGYMIPTPDAIADPAVRRKYDEKVAANAAKAKNYRVQKELRQLDSLLSSQCDTYVRTAHPRSPASVKEMDAAVAAHVHNAERASHLRSLVAPLQR
jgi:hypothetical protein